MGGASPRPAMRRLLRGRQRARGRGCCIQGIRSLEPLGPKLPIRAMRVPRRPAIDGGGLVPARESTRSTWNACGGLSGLPSVDDRQTFTRRGSAVVPPTSCKRVRGAARWSPWPTRTKSRRRLTARREDFLGDSPGAISRAARRRAMLALERVTSARAASGGALTRTLVEVELLAMWVRAQQGGGIRTPRRKRLEIAKEAGGGGGSTWNVYGDVWPKAGDVPGGHATGGRIADQRRTLEATTGARIPA
jgi:hypothetical protein